MRRERLLRLLELTGTVLVLALAGHATASAVPAVQPVEAPIRVVVSTPAEPVAAGPPRGLLELVPLADTSQTITLPIDGSGSYGASATRETIWRVRAVVGGYWAAEELAVAGGAATGIALYPAGELRGRLTVPPNMTQPRELQVTFGPTPSSHGDGRSRPAGRVVCPVAELVWTCTLPAGVFDLRIHAPGFASALAWDVTVGAGDPMAGPALALIPGAAVLGRVEVDGQARLEEVEVELRPAGAATRDPEIGGRLGQLYRTTHADRRGYFQFEDLAPGVYRIEARHAGRAPAVREPVEVLAGKELDLVQPLAVAAPSELVLLIAPPVPPTEVDQGWNVELRALDGSNQSRITHADWTGAAEVDLAPGWYRLSVRDRRSTWLAEEIELPSGKSVRELELPLVAIEGTVRRGEKRQRARLDFGGQLPRAEEVHILTDPEGNFSGHLPAEGEWPLTVLLEPGGSEQRLEPVEVVERAGEDVVRLDIELPDTLLVGQVVDAAGQPVAQATVLAWQEGSRAGRSKARSNAAGRFRYWSLRSGEWIVEAFSGSRSGRVEIALEEAQPQRIEIRLGVERTLAGRVVSDAGPVAGALVYAIPDVPRTTPLSPWRTDPLGAFEARVPADTTGVHLFVLALGRPARLLWLPLSPEGEVRPEVVLGPAASSGTLRLQRSQAPSGAFELRHGAARLPIHLLQDWASIHRTRLPWDGDWTVPAMEPGTWELCRGDVCDRGFLPPGGELELSLRETEAAPETP